MTEVIGSNRLDSTEAPKGAASAGADSERQDVVTLHEPEPGEVLVVQAQAGLIISFEFSPAAATYAVDGDDFVLTLETGGQIIMQGLVSAAQGEAPPNLHMAGIDIGADHLIAQALQVPGDEDPVETAAGEEAAGEEAVEGGGSQYGDTFGDLIAGLIKQGIIDMTELGFGLTGSAGTEVLVDAEFLSEGYLLSASGFSVFDFEVSGVLSPTSFSPGGVGGPEPVSGPAPLSGGGDSGGDNGGAPLAPLNVNDFNIVTNLGSGNLEIPDELILYLANSSHGQGLSVSGPSYDGVTNNAYVWDAGNPAPGSANTWANDGNGNIKFHIGGASPTYEGSLTYEVSDQAGASGQGTIGVENFATAKAGSYWTLTGTGADEVLLGLDGRNQIDGGSGNDIIHGGHDASGDILLGGLGDDVIFGGAGNDDLQGGAGDDTFIMTAGFSQDTVDGGADTDIISLQSVLSQADVNNIASWLTAGQGYTHDTANQTITFNATANGTIDLGGGDRITFQNIEQIAYADLI